MTVPSYDFRRIVTASNKPLYDHGSVDTAYVIDDYPAGFKARCKMRVWLEFKPKQGWRLVQQTSDKWYPGEEPASDAQLRWNKPKAGTYYLLGACMYLDAQGHVQVAVVGPYDKPAKVLEFVKHYPKADFNSIKAWVLKQFVYIKAKLLGNVAFTVNNEVKPWSDHELGEFRKDLAEWAEVAKAVDLKVSAEIQDLIDGKIESKQIDPAAWKVQQQLRQEQLEAEKAKEVERTPGALNRAKFIEYLESLVKLDGRTLKIDSSRDTDQMFINFINLPKGEGGHGGAEAENNRQMYHIQGFDRKDSDKPVAKLKIELAVNHLGGYGPDRGKSNLRGKTGAPAKIAEYLAAHINKMVKEFEPKRTHS